MLIEFQSPPKQPRFFITIGPHFNHSLAINDPKKKIMEKHRPKFEKFQVLNQTSQNNQRIQNSKLVGFSFLPTNLCLMRVNRLTFVLVIFCKFENLFFGPC